jgi:hypothetical protein
VEACLRRGGDRDLPALRCVEQCRLLKAERDGYSDGLRRACAPHVPAHDITSRLSSRVPQSLWRSSATTGIRAPLSPLSPLLAGGGF